VASAPAWARTRVSFAPDSSSATASSPPFSERGVTPASPIETGVTPCSIEPCSTELPGHSSRTTCALVPPNPKPDTPARATPPFRGHGRGSVTTSSRQSSNLMCGFGALKCRLGGITPWRIASTTLSTPATPAAASRCPRFDLTDPRPSGDVAGRPWPRTAPSALASIGSPSRVPVPCAST
jgi:hypothetical protein